MIKRILAVGDSFTYGEELSNPSDAWPIQIGTLLKAEVVNLGQPGGGNKQMIRKVIDTVCGNTKEQEPFDLVVIGWSSPGRIEFADDSGLFDVWPGYGGNLFRKGGQEWRLELLDYINKYHTPEYLYQQYLFDVIMMQSFLKTQGVKYVMMNICANEYYHKTHFSKMKQRANLVDPTTYLGWPTEGMVEWAQDCKTGPNGHFLEDGHKKVTAKLYEHIRNCGWLS